MSIRNQILKQALHYALQYMSYSDLRERNIQLDLAFNNVKPKDWYLVLDLVRFRTELGYESLIM